MIFNHTFEPKSNPPKELDAATQQLLNDIEQPSLTLKGKDGKDISFNIADLHQNYFKVVIDERQTFKYDDSYFDELIERLKHQKEILEKLKDAIKKAKEEEATPLKESCDNRDNDGPKNSEEPSREEHKDDSIHEIDESEESHEPDEDPRIAEIDKQIEEIDKNIDEIDKNRNNKNEGGWGRITLLGRYESKNKIVRLFIKNIKDYANDHQWNWEHVMAFVYIHECFHAFFYQQAEPDGRHSIREIEEPMAEFGMLTYLESINQQDILKIAKIDVESKQKKGHLAAYGFGHYLYDAKKTDERVRILGEYAQKSKDIDSDSYDVIRYANMLMCEYPKGKQIGTLGYEGEKILDNLLLNLILNIGQKQVLSFEDLYKDSKAQIKKALLEKWQPKGAKLDPDYKTQIEAIINDTLCRNILVESMSPWEAATPIYKGGADYTKYAHLLRFLPFKHQVESWEKVFTPSTWTDANGKQHTDGASSIVVTTGTGSGKTECFMTPLIYDLENNPSNGVQAIFLYPLNALMDDQRKRLSEMITKSGKDITFAVYNGNSPYYDTQKQKKEKDARLPHELIYREEIRGKQHWEPDATSDMGGTLQSPGRLPNIILTNPTMLEYMLLRNVDKKIIDGSQQTLQWIVIDETHTYTGAGADELAMSIRRVLKAFNRHAEQVHFATSSATAGNDDERLKEFITGITGQKYPPFVISGQRSQCAFSLAKNLALDKARVAAMLSNNGFVYLHHLLPNTPFDEITALGELDRLAESGLKVKVHFNIKALTNGLYVDAEQINNNKKNGSPFTFTLHDRIEFDQDFKPRKSFLHVCHCTHCGELLAEIYVGDNGRYERDGQATELCYLAIDNGQFPVDKDSTVVDKILPGNNGNNGQLQYGNNITARGIALLSKAANCPICGCSNAIEEDENTGEKTEISVVIKRFNVSAVETMQSLSPTLLKNANANNTSAPFEGRQFISFADSRKGAAAPSLKQNLATEEHWVISTIFKKLKAGVTPQVVSDWMDELIRNSQDSQEKRRLRGILSDIEDFGDDMQAVNGVLAQNNIVIPNILTWNGALDALYSDPMCERLAACFAKDDDWCEAPHNHNKRVLTDDYKKQYVLSALYDTMHARKKNKFSAESYGIIKVGYERLNDLDNWNLPVEVDALNRLLPSNLQIKKEDWKALLKIYLDYTVRVYESLYYQTYDRPTSPNGPDWRNLDISACRDLRTNSSVRRSIRRGAQNEEEGRIHRLLYRLFNCNKKADVLAKFPNGQAIVDQIQQVVDCMWFTLIDGYTSRELSHRQYQNNGNGNPLTNHLSILTEGETIKDGQWMVDTWDDDDRKDKYTNYRLNLEKLYFELYQEAWVDGVNKVIHDSAFMGYAPYYDSTNKEYNIQLGQQPIRWEPNMQNKAWFETSANQWLIQNHADFLLCKAYENVYLEEPVFIQHEHTAQVNRKMAQARIKAFKDDHEINILACSTTMEMGVDIGELELVSMANVPPHPANYKQRAGRAGRAMQNKSACVTICNSDAIGLPVFEDPYKNLLARKVDTPSADLNSEQVCLRHVHSFLLREFLNTIQLPSGLMHNYRMIDFFFNQAFKLKTEQQTLTLWNGQTRTRNVLRFIAEENGGTFPVFPHPDAQYQNDYRQFFGIEHNLTPPRFVGCSDFNDGSYYAQFRNWLTSLLSTSNGTVEQDLMQVISGTKLEKENLTFVRLVKHTLDSIESVHNDWRETLDDMANECSKDYAQSPNNWAWTNGIPNLKGYARRLSFDFISLLNKRLVEYLCTHQFIPNANMPTEVVSLLINRTDDNNYENPSRDLRIALNEYAPGNHVVIDGKTYDIAGVEWKRTQQNQAFEKYAFCSVCGRVWRETGNEASLTCTCGETNQNKNANAYRIKLRDLIEPTGFVPELATSRLLDNTDLYNDVEAQLIDAPNWGIATGGLYQTRLGDLNALSNGQMYDPRILYYNPGAGNGWCVCNIDGCGRTAPEKIVSTNSLQDLKVLFPEDPKTHKFRHVNLHKPWVKDLATNRNVKNFDDLTQTDVFRHCFIGGTFSTNYAEFKPCWLDAANNRVPFKPVDKDKAVLTTLGIMICDKLSEFIPCERQDIDFVMTHYPDGMALCIFDTAKGGAGYSNHLTPLLWADMLQRCADHLSQILNKPQPLLPYESLFSRSTMRYFNDVDVKATYEWLQQEYQSRNPLPAAIKQAYPNAIPSYVLDMEDAIKSGKKAIVFTLPDVNKWNYEDDLAGKSWKEIHTSIITTGIARKHKFAFCGDPGIIPAEANDIIKHIEAWTKFYLYKQEHKDIYPLAYVDGWLYLTDAAEAATLNEEWATHDVYAVMVDTPEINPCTLQAEDVSELNIPADARFTSDKLLANVMGLDRKNMIQHFAENAKGHRLHFTYMDEHLKTQLGMHITLQFVEAFCQLANTPNRHLDFINETYSKKEGSLQDDPQRRLWYSLYDEEERDVELSALLDELDWEGEIERRDVGELPHWRCLTIEDMENGNKLVIKPHGGFANDLNLDLDNAKRRYRCDDTAALESLPLRVHDQHDVEYTISVVPNKK